VREYGAAALLGLLLIVGGTIARFSSEPEPPFVAAKPPPPPAAVVTRSLRWTPTYYRGIVEGDAKSFGVPVDWEVAVSPYPFATEFEGSRALRKLKDGFDTPHLKISVDSSREWTSGLRSEHLLLRIKNKTDRFVAYRVLTQMADPRACTAAAAIAHDAIALKPHEEVTRVECVQRAGDFTTVKRVDVMELTALGYYYVSRLHPPQVLYDARTSAGHTLPAGKACPAIPWREIKDAEVAGETSWFDVMDFYARHSCDEYTFWRGYKAARKEKIALPAAPPGEGQHAP
jgi:hypothetical protein